MQRIGNIFDKVYNFNNLLLAYKKARAGTKMNDENAAFFFYLEKELHKLSEELKSETYEPGTYTFFKIYDPKERLISVAPFRDRVVHHALVGTLEPYYEKCFIYDSYATRKEKGTHKAIERAQQFLRNSRWYLKTDIDKYFASIDHEILIKIISGKIKDKTLLRLTEKIIRNGGQNGKGLPIGNLTSQFFANVYLNPFDHFIKEELQIRHYLRYMDDFVFFDNNKDQIKKLRKVIVEYLRHHLNLELKESATYINQRINGLSFLGVRVFPNTIRIKNENLRRMVKRYKVKKMQVEGGKLSEEKFIESINSYYALFRNYNTFQLRSRLIQCKEFQSFVIPL